MPKMPLTARMTEDRYEIQDAVGEGGSGSVFRAWDTQLGRFVAIKRLKGHSILDVDLQEEAALLAALQHPNIVTIYDFGEDDEGPFVIMELVNGRTLDVLATEQPLSLYNFGELANQVCRGLAAAHSRRLTHQDLKPENLMVHFHEDHSFTAKILDFGLAAIEQEDDADGTDEVVGSVWTISPEQLRKKPPDVRSDIYSLGCTFYFALAGHYPYDGTVPEIVNAHLYAKAVPLHLVRRDIPLALSDLIARMLAPNPDDRPQTAEEVRQIAIAAVKEPPAADEAESSAGTPAWKSPKIIGAIAAVVLIAGGASAWFFFHHRSAKPAITAAQAAQTPVPVKVVYPKLDPLDEKSFTIYHGKIVEVEGTPIAMTQSELLATRNLLFAKDEKKALTLAFPFAKFPEKEVKDLVGKRLRATGTLTARLGAYRLVLEKSADIELVQSSKPSPPPNPKPKAK
jgi:hypothetical protein